MRKTNILIMLIPILLSCETGKVNIKPSPSHSVSVTSSVNSPSPSSSISPVTSASPTVIPSQSNSEPESGKGKIVFSARNLNSEQTQIYSINPDGSELTQLTDESLGNCYSPKWSPDYNRIIFSSYKDKISQNYIMNFNGKNKQILSDEVYSKWFPDVNKLVSSLVKTFRSGIGKIFPNSKKILFLGNEKEKIPLQIVDVITYLSYSKKDIDIYSVNLDGTELVNITNTPDISETGIDISYDSKKVVFTTNKYSLSIYDFETKKTQEILTVKYLEEQVSKYFNTDLSCVNLIVRKFSSDGKRISFTGWFGFRKISENPAYSPAFLIDTDGKNFEILPDIGLSGGLNWSPDGANIMYTPETYGVDDYSFKNHNKICFHKGKCIDINKDIISSYWSYDN